MLNVFQEGAKSSFIDSGEVPFQYLKTFVATGFSTLSFVGSQFISLNSLAPICYLELSFKQKQIHLF